MSVCCVYIHVCVWSSTPVYVPHSNATCVLDARKSVEVNTYYAMNLSQAYLGAVMPIWSILWKL